MERKIEDRINSDKINSKDLIKYLRKITNDYGIKKPDEGILKTIEELLQKEGENYITYEELQKMLKNVAKRLGLHPV